MSSTPAVALLERSPFVPQVDAGALGDESLLAEIRAVEAFRKQLDAHQIQLLGEADARGTTDTLHGHRTKDWLVAQANIDSATATAQLKVARRLRSDLPETATALAEGRISFDHARALAYAWSPRIAAELAEAEPALLADAERTGFKEWKSNLAMLVALIDQDGAYDPDADLERNILSMAVVGDELIVKATLLGDRRVIVEQTIDHFADELFRRYRDERELTGIEIPSRVALQAEALAEICRRARAVDLSQSRPAEPEAVIVIDGSQLDETVEHGPQASDADGNPLQKPGQPLGSVFKLACSATLRAVIVDGLGVPMDHGREIRSANRAQRRLLKVRDGGCTFPGCCAPAAWTDGHHIRWWHRDHGTTDVANLLSLCRFHHGVVHRKGWGVRLTDDGWAIFTRPDGVSFWGQRHGRQRAGPAPPRAA